MRATMKSLVCAVVLVAGGTACGSPPAGSTGATATAPATLSASTSARTELAWATYELHAEPRYRLLMEGTTEGRPIEQVRIIDTTGREIAAVVTTATANETLAMCGPTKSSGPTRYGPSRATFALSEAVFKSFLADPSAYRVEAREQGVWRPATLRYTCSATE